MKFKFSSLGPLDEAEVDLAKLTIICGKNNTGKTYVSYTIYGFFANWYRIANIKVNTADFRRLLEQGSIGIDLEDKVANKWMDSKEKFEMRWQESLPDILAAPPARFTNTKLTFDFSLDSAWIERPYTKEFMSESGKVILSANKPANCKTMELVAIKDETDDRSPRFILESMVSQTLMEAVFSPYIPNVFMVSSERTGAVTFKEELNLTKNRLVSFLSKTDVGKESFNMEGLFNAVYKHGYPIPVEHNVIYVNRFASLESRSGSLIIERPDILEYFESITGGRYETNKDGVTHFVPIGTKVKLQLSEASSSARSLVLLWYWLNFEATNDSILIIDEPEMNLHPENQRAFARFIALLTNAGVSVFITTHSDTIVREINTLLMLSRNSSHFREIMDKYNYKKEELLSLSDVRLYVANGKQRTLLNRVKKGSKACLIEIKPTESMGLTADIFDETIETMSSIQDAIRYGAE
jgi:hypothetical protein